MKSLLKVLSIVVSVSMCVCAFADNANDAKKDAAYLQLKKLVGGVWRSKVQGTTVESRWKVGPDGVSLIGETLIGADTPTPYHMNARFGWDAKEKKVYYLDSHGLDTVYFGHAAMDGNDAMIAFRGIVGDPGTFFFSTSFKGEDTYHATLYEAKDGKRGKVIENFEWTRSKE